jgi:hypothetical protein
MSMATLRAGQGVADGRSTVLDNGLADRRSES